MTGGQFVGQDGGQRLPDGVHHVHAQFAVHADRAGPFDVEATALRRDDMQGAEGAVVGGVLGRGDALEHGAAARKQRAPALVEGRRRRRVGAGEVEGDLVAVDVHSHGNADGVTTRPGGIGEVFPGVDAVGDGADRFTDLHLRVGEDLRHGGVEGLDTVFVHEFADAPLGDATGGHLRLQIPAHAGRDAHVAQDHLIERFVEHTPVVQLHHREDQPFLKNFGGVGHLAEGHFAAQVDPMGAHGAERGQLALVEDRADRHHVVEVGAAAVVGIVGDDQIAGVQAVHAEFAQRRLHRQIERAEEHGQPGSLADQLGITGKDAGAKVEHFVDNRAHRRALDHLLHLVGDGDQIVTDHLNGDLVNRVAHGVPFLGFEIEQGSPQRRKGRKGQRREENSRDPQITRIFRISRGFCSNLCNPFNPANLWIISFSFCPLRPLRLCGEFLR